jgi:hypothetical protein
MLKAWLEFYNIEMSLKKEKKQYYLDLVEKTKIKLKNLG